MTTDFRALCAELADELDAETGYTKNDGERITHLAVARARAALATPPPEPPKNCWLDDEPDLFPSPCVFDDPSEVINNCTYARAIKCKTDCKYYRVVTHPEPVQASPPEAPTDEELWEIWNNHDGPIPAILRAALERWGQR